MLNKIIAAMIMEIKKLIVASENPNILKFTSLQDTFDSFNESNNLVLSIIFIFSFLQEDNSEKILFSTPVWYPDRAALERNINNNKYNHIKFLLKLYPIKQTNIARR